MSEFKVGDVIVFIKDIRGYERDTQLIISADVPCKILKLNKPHITVECKGTHVKLRNIPSRMKLAGELAGAIYG